MNVLDNFKRCPRCASEQVSLDAEKAIVCQDCGFTYYQNMASAVGGIIEYDSRILLTRRARDPQKSMLDLPGGFVDYGEKAEEALVREVYEELNLRIEEVKYLTSAANTYFYKDVLYHVLDLFFVCPVGAIEAIQARDDVAEFLLFKPEQIPFNELAFESTKSALGYYNARR
jgi:ADP-ribose pyrophosphatase YjhB (NUDIX family)